MTEAEWIREMTAAMGAEGFCEAIALQKERPRLGGAEAVKERRVSRSTQKITGTIKIVKR